ncbi:hypothetical protein N0V90_005468 [Kalmusia sp. IMI 367209]|nr:hypothetical protein N0V90_005468 [Kalmusia sp. IMI 367209]
MAETHFSQSTFTGAPTSQVQDQAAVPSYQQNYNVNPGFSNPPFSPQHIAFEPPYRPQQLPEPHGQHPVYPQYNRYPQWPFHNGYRSAVYMGTPGAMFQHGPPGTPPAPLQNYRFDASLYRGMEEEGQNAGDSFSSSDTYPEHPPSSLFADIYYGTFGISGT